MGLIVCSCNRWEHLSVCIDVTKSANACWHDVMPFAVFIPCIAENKMALPAFGFLLCDSRHIVISWPLKNFLIHFRCSIGCSCFCPSDVVEADTYRRHKRNITCAHSGIHSVFLIICIVGIFAKIIAHWSIKAKSLECLICRCTCTAVAYKNNHIIKSELFDVLSHKLYNISCTLFSFKRIYKLLIVINCKNRLIINC